VTPEELPGATLRFVAFDRGTQFSRRRHAEPRCRGPVRHGEERHEAAVEFCPGLVNSLEFRPSSNPLLRRQALVRHEGTRDPTLPLVRDSEALSTLRPAPLEDDTAILRRHSDAKTVGFLPTTGIGLVGALPLHDVLSVGRIK